MHALPARRPRRAPATSIALVAALAAGPAAASPGEDTATDGAVFAGVTGADPANLTSNPAALLRLESGVHVFAIGRFALDQIQLERRTVSADTGDLSAGPTVDATTFGAGVTGGLVWKRPRSVLAIAVSLRPPDETIVDDAVGYHTRGTRVRRIDWGSAAVSVAVTRKIYVGAGFVFADRRRTVRFARDTALEAGRDPDRGVDSLCDGVTCGLEHPAARELWAIDVTGDLGDLDNLVYTAGAVVRLPGAAWVGLAVERPVQLGNFEMSGQATIVRAPRDGGATLHGDALVRQRLPEVVRLGGRGPLAPGWELTGELRWRRLGRTDPIDVRVFGGELVGTDVPEWTLRPQGLRDAYAAEVGAEQIDLGQRVRIGGRFGFDTGPVADQKLSPRAPWGTQFSLALGGQLRLDRWILQLGYRVDAQIPTSSDPSAYDPIARLDCVESGYDYDLPACAAVRGGYGTSTAAGTYDRLSHSARVVVRFVIP